MKLDLLAGGLAAAAVLAVTAWASSARAAPELVWNAPEGCPDAAAVRASFSRMSHEAASASVRAVATIHVSDGMSPLFELELSLSARSGSAEVRLVSARCETLAEVVALELALAADANAVTTALAAPEHEAAFRGGATLFLGETVGPLPGASPGLRASVQLEMSSLRFEVGGKYLSPKRTTYRDVPTLGAELGLSAGFARVCSSLPAVGFGVSTCAGAEVGAVHGAGFGAAQTFTSTRLWGSATAAPLLRYAFPVGITLLAECELGLAFVRPEFHARGLPTMFQSDRTSASLWLGVGDAF